MAKYIRKIGAGGTLQGGATLHQYEKTLNTEGDFMLEEDSRGDLLLDYSATGPLFFFNRVKNLQYRTDSLFSRVGELTASIDSMQAQTDGYMRETLSALADYQAHFDVLGLLTDFGAEASDYELASYEKAQVGRVTEFTDPKTGRSLQGREAAVIPSLNLLGNPDYNADSSVEFARAQVIRGELTAASDYDIVYQDLATRERITTKNLFTDSQDWFYHGTFLTREHRSSIPRSVGLALYLELLSPSKVNYFSLETASGSEVIISKLEAKTLENPGVWTELWSEASPTGFSLTGHKKRIFWTTPYQITAYRLTLKNSSSRAIEMESTPKGTQFSTGSLARYYQDIGEYRDVTTTSVSGSLFEFALNNVKTGYQRGTNNSIAQIEHVVMNKRVGSVLLLQDGIGHLENYLKATYLLRGEKLMSLRVPIKNYGSSGVNEVLSWSPGGLVRGAISPLMFLADWGETFTLKRSGTTLTIGTDYAISLDRGMTWANDFATLAAAAVVDSQEILVRLSDYDTSQSYSASYSFRSDPVRDMSDERPYLQGEGGEVLLRTDIEYDAIDFKLISILRDTPSDFSFINRSALVVKQST